MSRPSWTTFLSRNFMIPKELLKKVRQIQIRTSRVVNDVFAGQYHSAFRGRGMEFEEVSPYQIGDDVRLIDWNVSARYGERLRERFCIIGGQWRTWIRPSRPSSGISASPSFERDRTKGFWMDESRQLSSALT